MTHIPFLFNQTAEDVVFGGKRPPGRTVQFRKVLNSCGRRPPACFRPVAFPRPAAKEIACPESEWLWRRFPAAGRVGAPLAGCRQGAPGGLAGCDRTEHAP